MLSLGHGCLRNVPLPQLLRYLNSPRSWVTKWPKLKDSAPAKRGSDSTASVLALASWEPSHLHSSQHVTSSLASTVFPVLSVETGLLSAPAGTNTG